MTSPNTPPGRDRASTDPSTAAPAGKPAVRPIPFDDEEDEPYGDPSKVKDRGPLESLGEAVSSPVRKPVDPGR